MNTSDLPGLEATNPLGFLAALGVQVACSRARSVPELWWSPDVIPHAIVDGSLSVEAIADHAVSSSLELLQGPAIKSGLKPVGDVKFKRDDLRAYLRSCREHKPWNEIATSFVAEGSYDNNGTAKPTDLHFTAGKMLFLSMIENVINGVTRDDILIGLEGPWKYDSKLSSLMWDIVDDRNYALLSSDPAKEKKPTNPGAETLAVLGLCCYPVFGSPGRTLTLGASGSWKFGQFTWPVWDKPASQQAVKTLLAHASASGKQLESRSTGFAGWGISQVLQSDIRRSSQGGYGTFGPPRVIWRRDE